MLTGDQTARIAGAILCLRDTWTEQMVRATLTNPEIARRDARAVAIAFTACATDPATKYPNRLLEPGPWWQLVKWTNDEGPVYRHADPRDCGVCNKPESECLKDGHDYTPAFVRRDDRATPDLIARVRQAAIDNHQPLKRLDEKENTDE